MVRRRNSWDPYATTASGPRAVDPAWHSAQAGDRVRVAFPDGTELEGTIDVRTPDAAVVWILVEGGERRMIHPGDGLALAPA